jgi:mannose-1-phosphate guanylyltransferase / mannose-6-phosphate isomerase
VPDSPLDALKAWDRRYDQWLMQAALPLWLERDFDRALGGFREALLADGSPADMPRRCRVQGRQSYVFFLAGEMGWSGNWRDAAISGLTFLDKAYKRPDGFFRTLVSDDGKPLDEAVMIYDQAFALLANAWGHKMMPGARAFQADALALRDLILKARRHPAGGLWETGDRKFISNPHMHLLEAALAWIEVAPDAAWNGLADEIIALCLSKFIDPAHPALHEFFDESWAIARDAQGGTVEPGHQFEWAWLLARWANLRGRADVHDIARGLYATGTLGVDAARHAAMDEMGGDLKVRRGTARLWPQTERLKAALLLADSGKDRDFYLKEAADAALGLWGYLETPMPGLWRDKLGLDGRYADEAAPASSLYHIACAIDCLRRATR